MQRQVCTAAAQKVIALPIFSGMTNSQINTIFRKQICAKNTCPIPLRHFISSENTAFLSDVLRLACTQTSLQYQQPRPHHYHLPHTLCELRGPRSRFGDDYEREPLKTKLLLLRCRSPLVSRRPDPRRPSGPRPAGLPGQLSCFLLFSIFRRNVWASSSHHIAMGHKTSRFSCNNS